MNRIERLLQELCPEGVEHLSLGGYIEIYTGVQFNKRDMSEVGTYPVLNGGINPSGFTEKYNEEEDTITISQGGASAGYVNWMNCKFWAGAHCFIVKPDLHVLNNRYLYFVFKNSEQILMQSKHGAGIPGLNRDKVRNLIIPVPPLPIQEEIVRIIDHFTELAAELQAELQARKEQYEYYRNKLLTFEEDDERVRWMKMGEIGEICMCKRILKHQTNTISGIPFYKIGTFGKMADAYISNELYEDYKNNYSFPKKGEILLSASGTIGKSVIYDGRPAYFQDSNIIWISNNESVVLNKYLYYYYQITEWKTEGGTIKRLYNANLAKMKIAVPPLSEQQRIVSILDHFETLVNDLSQGLPAEIAAVQEQYEYYRNKLLTFNRKA